MPFKSEKQRRYLWANEPAIARKWANKYAGGGETMPGLLTNTDVKMTMKDDQGATVSFNAPKGVAMDGLLGGLINGQTASPVSDHKKIMVTPGEFVVNYPAAQKYKPLLERINNEGKQMLAMGGYTYAMGGNIKYANGGEVKPADAPEWAVAEGTVGWFGQRRFQSADGFWRRKDGSRIAYQDQVDNIIKYKEAPVASDRPAQNAFGVYEGETIQDTINTNTSMHQAKEQELRNIESTAKAPYTTLQNLPQTVQGNVNAPREEMEKYYDWVVDPAAGTFYWKLNPQKVDEAKYTQSVQYADQDEATIDRAGKLNAQALSGMSMGQIAGLLRNPNLSPQERAIAERIYNNKTQGLPATGYEGGLGSFDPMAHNIWQAEQMVAADTTDREDLGTASPVTASTVALPGGVADTSAQQQNVAHQYKAGVEYPVTSREEASRLVARGVVAVGAIFILPNGETGRAK